MEKGYELFGKRKIVIKKDELAYGSNIYGLPQYDYVVLIVVC
jgi:hypothetical protein